MIDSATLTSLAGVVVAISAGIVMPMLRERGTGKKLAALEAARVEDRLRIRALEAEADQREKRIVALEAEIERQRAERRQVDDLNAMLATEVLVRAGLYESGARVLSPDPDVPAARKTRVLLVEDDEGLRRSFESQLRRAGFAVTAVETRGAALHALKSAQYDTVVLDLKLPDGPGSDVLKHVRKTRANTRVIVTTGYEPDGLLNGFTPDRVLEKPVKPDDLFAAVRGEDQP